MKKTILFLVSFMMSCIMLFGIVTPIQPVFDGQNLYASIEQTAKVIEQIRTTIKMVENQYQQLKQFSNSVKNIDWASMGDGFKLNKFTNPMEMLDAQIEKLRNIKGLVDSNLFSINGVGFSIADLTGANKKDKTFDVALEHGKNYFTKNANKIGKALTKVLDEAEKNHIMFTTGLTPEQYAMNKFVADQIDKKCAELITAATPDAMEQELKAFFEENAEVLKKALDPNGKASMAEIMQGQAVLQKQMIDSIIAVKQQLGQMGAFMALEATKEKEAERSEKEKIAIKKAAETAKERTDPASNIVHAVEEGYASQYENEFYEARGADGFSIGEF